MKFLSKSNHKYSPKLNVKGNWSTYTLDTNTSIIPYNCILLIVLTKQKVNKYNLRIPNCT